MRDVQSESDARDLPLDAVGVAGVRLPVVAFGRPTVAEADLAVSLGADQRGTHMSRLVEVLQRHREAIDLPGLSALLEDARERLGAGRVQVALRFPLFFSRQAPVSKAAGLLDVDVALRATLSDGGLERWLDLAVPVQSLCPCSKAVSDYGAHNQRGTLTLSVEPRTETPDLDALVALAEGQASAPVYPVLKRPDERHVTMQAYDTPVFVEDMVRGVAEALAARADVGAFRVRAVNEESIHNHQAVAEVSRGRR